MNMRLFCFFTFLFLVAGASSESFINVPLFDKAPKIDGNLNDDCWKNAFIVDRIQPVDGNQKLRDNWKVLIGCDITGIYIGIDADVSQPERIVSVIEKRDDRVWKDDCFEMMINLGEKDSYTQLLMNTRSVRCDLIHFLHSSVAEPQNFDGDWSGACQVMGNKIFAEFKIPYSMFALYGKKDNDFRINICRENKNQNEYSSISGTFHEIEKFPILKNLPVPDILKQVKISDVKWSTFYGPNIVRAIITNSTGKILKYAVEIIDRTGYVADVKNTGKINENCSVEIVKKYVIGGPAGEREISMRLIDMTTGQVLKTVNRVFQLEPPIFAYTDRYFYDENDEKIEVRIKANVSPEVLKDARVKIFLQKGKEKILLWQKKTLQPEMSAMIDIKNMNSGISILVIQMEYGKTKEITTTVVRKGKGPFYNEEAK